MFQKILIASQNQGKIREIRSLLATDFPQMEIISAADLAETKDLDPVETGETFTENAELKARAFARATARQYPVLADDSGIIVPTLTSNPAHPFPGVYSARWYKGTDTDRLRALLTLLREKHPAADLLSAARIATYECVFCFYNPLARPEQVKFFSGNCAGHLAFEPHGSNGFGYDPAFIPDGYEQTFGELSPEVKNQLSHRAVALRKLKTFLLTEII